MAKAVAGYSVRYFIDNKKLIPHLSLFHLRTTESRFRKLEQIVEKIASRFAGFPIESIKFEQYGDGTGVNYVLSKPRELQKLNKETVVRVKSLRTGVLYPWYRTRKYSRIQQDYIKKYGTIWSVEKGFIPHFTMGRFISRGDAAKVVEKMKKINFEFMADTIAICEINNNGQVYKILKTLKLK